MGIINNLVFLVDLGGNDITPFEGNATISFS
jgi:hypothetical protein